MSGVGINDRGQVIGSRAKSYRDPGDFQWSSCYRAFVWWGGKAVELGGIGLTKPCDVRPHGNSLAIAINAKGLIVGYSNANFVQHAVLWAPRSG